MARPKIEVKNFKLNNKVFTVKVDGEMLYFFCGEQWICDMELKAKPTEAELKAKINIVEPLLKMAVGIQTRTDKPSVIKFEGEAVKRTRRTKTVTAEIEVKPKRKRRTKAEMELARQQEQAKPKTRKTRSDKGKPRKKVA